MATKTHIAKAVAMMVGLVCGVVGCGSSTTGSQPVASKTSRAAAKAPFTLAARYNQTSLGIKDARAIALGPDGNLYITDRTDHLTVVSRTGQVLRRWGGTGSAAGNFRFVSPDPSDATDTHGRLTVAYDGTVYVGDSGNFRVDEFTPQGRFLRSYGGPGNKPGQFVQLLDVVTDSKKNVYAIDDQLGTVTKFSAAGRVLWQVGGAESPDPDLVGHLHMSVIDPHGRLILANDDRGRVVFLDENGRKVDAFDSRDKVTNGACDATVDSAGNIYTAGCGVGSGAVFNRAHHLVTDWTTIDGVQLFQSPRFASDGLGYAVATDGSLVVLRRTSG